MICAGGLPYEFVHDSTKAGSGTIRMTLGKAGRYVGSVQTMLIEDDLTPSWNEIIAKRIQRWPYQKRDHMHLESDPGGNRLQRRRAENDKQDPQKCEMYPPVLKRYQVILHFIQRP